MRLLALTVVVVARAALAQVAVVGDIVLVTDPTGSITNLVTGMGAILPSPQEQFCRAAYNQARTVIGDDYDGVVSFTASEALTDLNNVWQGPPVRAAASCIGRVDTPWKGTYNSNKLGQCVFMGTLGRTQSLFGGPGPEALPADPEAAWAPSLGIPIPGITSLTGIEMLGHEYGHHWLMGIEFDQNDGRGRQHFIRGFGGQNGENGQDGSPNQHYSHYADSRSVMYGECITEVDAGTFRVQGCPRKYSHVDQYLMGLRAPCEVSPMLVLEDPADPGKGVDTIAMGRTTSAETVTNRVRHDVSADEIVRAMGARAPAYPSTQRCWRVAFIVVLAPGQTSISSAMMQKVERYRQAWGPWFNMATDGRGTMDSRVNGAGCVPVVPDGGVVEDVCVTGDAGVPDAGAEDAGTAEDGGTGEDGGAGDDGGLVENPDAGPGKWETCLNCETGKIRPGCGCGAAGGAEWIALGAALAAVLLRRRR